MINTRAILDAMSGMQSNAQSALPVTPNNGNPAGAYNMPQGQGEQQAPPDPWPWLQPSPFMATLQQDLAARSERLRQELALSNQEPAVPVPQLMQQPPVMQQPAPTLPMRTQGLQQSVPQQVPNSLVLPIRNQMVR